MKWNFEASQKAIIFGMKNELEERRIGTTSYYETKTILQKMDGMKKSVLDQFDSISNSAKFAVLTDSAGDSSAGNMDAIFESSRSSSSSDGDGDDFVESGVEGSQKELVFKSASSKYTLFMWGVSFKKTPYKCPP